jgi:hypothetical protein
MPDVLTFSQLLLRHPLLIGEGALVVAVLFGAGRALGLPLLFWHERLARQFLAGVAATLAMAEILFVAYLSDRSDGAPLELRRVLHIGGAAWAAAVAAAWLYRLFLRTPWGARSSPVVTPRFLRVDRAAEHSADPGGPASSPSTVGAPGQLASADPATWPFLAGSMLGGCIVAGIAKLGEAIAYAMAAPSGGAPPMWSLHVAAAAAFGVLLTAFLFSPVSTPAVEICLLLGLVAAAYGAMAYWLHSTGVGLAITFVLFATAGLRPYRLRVTALAKRYARPTDYPPKDRAPIGALLRFNAGWPERGPRPLVLVCASGGGIRAAAWTAAILERLDATPSFRSAVRMITGASGGMVGAAFWVARLHAGGTPRGLLRVVAGDALSPVAHRLVFRDIPYAFLPFVNLDHRGEALESAWSAQSGGELDVAIRDLRDAEDHGRLPSLVFSPLIVEDGRRLIISNLDLSAITTNAVRWLGGATLEAASLSAFHVEHLVPGGLGDLPLRTAARLSASFPYVSPACTLPTRPGRRVADAAYYDNYGLSLACEWLRQCLTSERSWLTANVSRVLLIQIRDGVSELSIDGRPRAEPTREISRFGELGAAVARGFEWATSPISAVLSARDSVTLFRNDAALEAATQLCDAQMRPGFLSTTIFEFKGEASLSWYLTEAEIDGLNRQADSPGIRSKLDAIRGWLDDPPAS